MEGEGGDKQTIELPACQQRLIKAMHATGRPVIVVNCSGSAIALQPETENCDAILQVWYPGQEGGTAVADVLFGDYNPSGKLPVTFYKSTDQLPDYEEYSMKGRTYRYFDDPLFAFGYGLSYTQFKIGEARLTKEKAGGKLKLVVPVTNAGKRNGTEIVQVYLRDKSDAEGPLRSLRAFQRISVKGGETVNVELTLDANKALEFFDPATNTMRGPSDNKQYELWYGNSSRTADLKKMEFTW
jgi:beta-glucosidase